MPSRRNTAEHNPFNIRSDVLVCLLLIITISAVYWQVGNHEFINLDDTRYITENRHIQKGLTLESITWSFSITDISYWHPLTWLSLMLDYEFYGTNPRGYHLTNVVLHILNALLLFLILSRMTGSLWRSAIVAALFALHPLNVESVAWAVERKNVLSTFFWMLTLLAYSHYSIRPSLPRYLLLALFFGLGLMTKPMLVTLPCVLFLLDYWPLGRLRFDQLGSDSDEKMDTSTVTGQQHTLPYRLILEKVPLLVLSGIAAYVTSLSAQRIGMAISTESVPIKLRTANGLFSYVSYIAKMIWPQNLAVFYPYPSEVPIWQSAGAGMLLLGVSVLILRSFRKVPYLLTGWLWYLGTLLPVIGLKQAGLWPAMADRFSYVPLIGLFIIIAWGIPDLVRGWHYRSTFLTSAGGVVVAALMLTTWTQLQHWKNSLTLFEHALRVTKNNYLAHLNFGAALADQGKVEEAISHYNRSLQIAPNYAKTYNNLGLALAQQGKNDEAMTHYLKALQLNPDDATAHNNLGVVLARTGEFDKAIAHYHHALSLKPNWVEVYNNLGNAFLSQAKFDQAIFYYSETLRLKPGYGDAHNNLAIALANRGRFPEALEHYYAALQLKPNSAETHNNLAVALLNLGKVHAATAHYNKAIDLSPNYSEAHNNLGNLLLEQDKLDEAISSFVRALEIRPGYAEPHNNLGVALARQGRFEEAIDHFREALRLKPDYEQARTNLEFTQRRIARTR